MPSRWFFRKVSQRLPVAPLRLRRARYPETVRSETSKSSFNSSPEYAHLPTQRDKVEHVGVSRPEERTGPIGETPEQLEHWTSLHDRLAMIGQEGWRISY
jgi:hypothetical protein